MPKFLTFALPQSPFFMEKTTQNALPCVAAIGTFDGIHRGHQAVFDKMREVAQLRGAASRIITFANHPLSVLCPDKAPKWVNPRLRNNAELARYADFVSVMDFTPDLAALTAAEFLRQIREQYGVGVLVMGPNNTFGSDCLKAHADYVAAGREAGVEVVFADAVTTADGRLLSSTRLRDDIALAALDDFGEIAGTDFAISGTVVHGKRLGHSIGIPTINIDVPDDVADLPDGVYAGSTVLPDGRRFISVMSIGNNPTVRGGRRTHEVHVIGHDIGETYGQEVAFFPRRRIRDICAFDSLDDLKRQIQDDIASASEAF